MASVYSLIGHANTLPNEIIKENACLELPIKRRYLAALTIQRCYRGFVVRQMIARWHKHAVTIQKVVRGWLVRWHRADYLREYLARIQKRDLDNCATKIQAYWKGYRVRKALNKTIREMVERRQLIQERSRTMKDSFRIIQETGGRKAGLFQEVDKRKLEDECRRWVLFILFKTHHLTRTKCKEGIYSLHGTDELSPIEYWMKNLPLKKYMDDLRKMYNNHYSDEQVIDYIFHDRRAQKTEYYYKTRDRSRDVKSSMVLDKNIHEKSFDLYKRPKPKSYQKSILNTGKYTRNDQILLRTFSKFSTEFDLFVHKPGKPCKEPPPYYIDFWKTQCKVHYPEDD
ncbi:hypothetical protein Trydic_g16073 [Trypoxylus dichotomus]